MRIIDSSVFLGITVAVLAAAFFGGFAFGCTFDDAVAFLGADVLAVDLVARAITEKMVIVNSAEELRIRTAWVS